MVNVCRPEEEAFVWGEGERSKGEEDGTSQMKGWTH